MKMKPIIWIKLSMLLVFISCEKDVMPKPYGNLRLEYPNAIYQEFESDCPFGFKYSNQSVKKLKKENCQFDIYYPKLKATIFLTYEKVDKNLNFLIADSEKSVYEPHSKRATYISPKLIIREKDRVFGTLYELGGETALNFQFHVTDSTKNFLRGAVYFNTQPKPDSLAPAIDYIKKDVVQLMETVKWK